MGVADPVVTTVTSPSPFDEPVDVLLVRGGIVGAPSSSESSFPAPPIRSKMCPYSIRSSSGLSPTFPPGAESRPMGEGESLFQKFE